MSSDRDLLVVVVGLVVETRFTRGVDGVGLVETGRSRGVDGVIVVDVVGLVETGLSRGVDGVIVVDVVGLVGIPSCKKTNINVGVMNQKSEAANWEPHELKLCPTSLYQTNFGGRTVSERSKCF